MNRIYKTIWNERTGTYVAVSEIAKGHGKKSSSVAVVALALLGLAGGVYAAGEQGGSAAAGGKLLGSASATITIVDEPATGDFSATGLKVDSVVINDQGIDAGGQKIIHVQAGSADDEAVNRAQLNDVAATVEELAGKSLVFAGTSGSTERKLGEKLKIVGSDRTVSTSVENGVLKIDLPYFKLSPAGAPAVTSATNGALAIGNGTTASGHQSIAIGSGSSSGATVTGQYSVAVGAAASVTSSLGKGVAIGYGAEVSGADASGGMAVGYQAKADSGATALGGKATAAGSYATAVGATAEASGEQSSALGTGAIAGGTYSTAIGAWGHASGEQSTVLGTVAEAIGKNGVALGVGAKALAAGGVALGALSVADTEAGVSGFVPDGASPEQAEAIEDTKSTSGAVSVGDAATNKLRQITRVAAGTADSDAANVAQLKAVGGAATAQGMNFAGQSGTAVHRDLGETLKIIGAGNTVSTIAGNGELKIDLPYFKLSPAGMPSAASAENGALAIGSRTMASGHESIAIGSGGDGATVTGQYSVGVGAKASITNPMGGAVAVGYGATVTGKDAFGGMAVGYQSRADGGATALGGEAVASGSYSTAVGRFAQSPGEQGTALGYASAANARYSTAVGTEAKASGEYSTALGPFAVAAGKNAIALGRGTVAPEKDAVALGPSAKALTSGGVALGMLSAATTEAGIAGFAPTGVSEAQAAAIKATMGTRGAVSVGDTAIQEFRQITSVAAGTADSDAVNVAQLKAVGSVATAQGMNFEGQSGTAVHRDLGETLKVAGADANITTETDGADTLKIALNKKLELESVTTGDTVMDTSGIRIKGATDQPDVILGSTGLSIGSNVLLGSGGLKAYKVVIDDQGINAGDQKITNVKAGTQATDAVNLAQLDALKTATAAGQTHYFSVNDEGTASGNYHNDGATGANSLAAGVDTLASGKSAIAIGKNAQAGIEAAVVLGDAAGYGAVNGPWLTDAHPYHVGAVFIGNEAGYKSIGNLNTYVGPMGAGEGTKGDLNVGLGHEAGQYSSGSRNISIGDGAGSQRKSGDNNIMLGYFAGIFGSGNYNIFSGDWAGYGAVGSNNIATGSYAGKEAHGDNNIFSGGYAGYQAKGDQNIASGYTAGAVLEGSNNIVTGSYAGRDAHGDNNIFSGALAGYQAKGDQNIAIGQNAGSKIIANRTVSLGANANVTQDDGIALGSSSVADTAAGVSGFIPDGASPEQAEAIEKTKSTSGAVSVGDAATNKFRQITSVAAGTADSDAVNVAQLKAVGSVATAQGMNFEGQSGTAVHRDLGETLKVAGADANITTETDGADTLKIALNKKLELESVTTGDTVMDTSGIRIKGATDQSDVVLNSSGLTINEVKINSQGIDAGSQKITGVADGSDDGDAVNFGQLKRVTQANTMMQSEIDILDDHAVQYDVNTASQKSKVTLAGGDNGTSITNVARADLSAASTDAVNGGQIHEVGSSIAEGIGGNTTFTDDGKLLTKLDVGGATYTSVGEALTGVQNTLSGVKESIDSVRDTADKGWNVQANNDAASKVAPGETVQFVNGDNIEVSRNGGRITISAAKNSHMESVTATQVNTEKVVTKEVVIENGPTIGQEGIDMHDRKITNVVAGTNEKDAVNVGQLNQVTSTVANNLSRLDNRISSVDNHASAGIAAAIATAGLPQAYLPGKSMFSLAGGTWRGESGYAMGLSTVSGNGKWVLKASANSSSRGDYGGSVGVGYQW
uniref:ESPR-type extended signal peptide-containing protein n=1 Tax=Castellaniella defragrans TaxID=75697 RepID=UPI00333E1F7C